MGEPTLDILDLSSRLAPRASWLFCDKEGRLRSDSLMERVHNSRLQMYITNRDIFRTKRGMTSKWWKYDIKLAAEIWQMKHQPQSRTLRNRLLFDKHWHGGNKAKDRNSTEADEKCPFCISKDSAGHWMVYCQANPRAGDIRTAMFKLIRTTIRGFAENKGKYKTNGGTARR